MDFNLSPDTEKLCKTLREFIEEEVMPLEKDRDNFNEYENIKLSKLDGMRAKARAAGLWS